MLPVGGKVSAGNEENAGKTGYARLRAIAGMTASISCKIAGFLGLK